MTLPTPSEASTHLPAEPSSAGAARRFVASTLDTWDLVAHEEVACLLISELVSNVLLHTRSELDVRLVRAGEGVRIEVHDGDPRLPERKFYSATSATGRGLVFVATLASSWGVEPTVDGKAVWFELDGSVGAAVAPAVAVDFQLDDWEDWDEVGGAGPQDPTESAAPSARCGASLQGSRRPVAVS